MLEAIQVTYVTTPTLMARFPGGRKASFRWVMIPGNEPTGDGRYVGITTVTAQQWQALARADRSRRHGRRRRARHDDRPVPPRRRSRTRSARVHDVRTTADEIVAACVEARVPAAIVGNGAELPRNEQLAARDVFVQQPGEHVDPTARAVPLPRCRRSRARGAVGRR